MIFVVDNYDSFVYNLVQYLGELGEKMIVRRNDQLDFAELQRWEIKAIVISPGPKTPREAGKSNELIKRLGDKIPILGVCLGHQCIGYVFGGRIVRAPRLVHGKTSLIYHDGRTIYKNLPNPFSATRYHSLIIEKKTLPASLEISAWTKEGIIMGIRHKKYSIEGVQFHPESILTMVGKDLLKNFLSLKSWKRHS